MVLVFDVEEYLWTESIPFPSSELEDKSFLCHIAEHKKQLCVIKIIDENGESMILELWSFDRHWERVWKCGEVIPPPSLPVLEINYFLKRVRINGGREFLSINHRTALEESSLWFYDMSHHTWKSSQKFKKANYNFQANLFRF